MKKHTLAIALAAALVAPAAQAAFVLPPSWFPGGGGWIQYGDAQSYSLPLLAYLYAQTFGGPTGPGNPYYINSTPGAIKDLIVIGTGASGAPVNTNDAGMDNAYPTPNSDGIPFFSTGTTSDPGQDSPFIGDRSETWDATVGALKTFLAKTGGATSTWSSSSTTTRPTGGGSPRKALRPGP